MHGERARGHPRAPGRRGEGWRPPPRSPSRIKGLRRIFGRGIIRGMNDTGKRWRGWRQGEFQAHFVHTGVAESVFFVFPDSTTMLLDCGDHAAVMRVGKSVPVLPGPDRMAGEWIARYVRRVNPNGAEVDWAVVSHFHSDHVGTPFWQPAGNYGENPRPLQPGRLRSGFGIAAESLRFRFAVDRGSPDYSEPRLFANTSIGTTRDFVRAVWDALVARDGLVLEKFRLGATDQFRPLRGDAPGFEVRNVCANGRIAMPGGSVLDPYADLPFDDDLNPLNENAMSLGMTFRYGEFSLVSCGDFSDRFKTAEGKPVFAEDLLAGALGPCSVAKVNHHGHHSMGAELAAALRPKAYVACVWDQLHCTSDAMAPLLVPDAPDALQPAIFPTVLPDGDDSEPWRRRVPDACREGCHVVVAVPPGGETFTVTLLDARDEEMRVAAEFGFESR